MAVYFCAKLQGFTGGEGTVGAGMQHRATVAKPGHAVAVQQMRIDAGNLRCAVCAQTQGAARQLVDQFEGLQIQRFAGAGEQRLQVFQQGRHDQFVAIAAGGIQEKTAQLFDVTRLGGQDIGNLIGQLP